MIAILSNSRAGPLTTMLAVLANVYLRWWAFDALSTLKTPVDKLPRRSFMDHRC